ncbi:hypothetical protein G9E11_15365 [Arthrobacter sp. IA7]|uniref:hypothetical protein n=1 Tax=Arthrobacter ipis TaxID=2716202 RepID=UPI0016825348|nr:hypothetical protein [Arthrobacter ipis]MBD1543590.1 hypothetical protein [Arthrobacter ipis]
MNFLRGMMALPQPVKGCLLAYLIVFAVAFVAIPITALTGRGQMNHAVLWIVAALGASAVVLGVVLATDLRGSARAYATLLKDFKPMGVDYSKSIFATPKFVRFFGAMFALVGIWFIVASTFFASSFS